MIVEYVHHMHHTALERGPHASHAPIGNEYPLLEMRLDALMLLRGETVTRGPMVDVTVTTEQPRIRIAEPGCRLNERIYHSLQLER